MLKYKNKQYTKRVYHDQVEESQARLLLENALVDYHCKKSSEKNLGLAFLESTEMTICTSKDIQGNQRKCDERVDIVWKEAAGMKGGEDSEKQKKEASCP